MTTVLYSDRVTGPAYYRNLQERGPLHAARTGGSGQERLSEPREASARLSRGMSY